METNYLIGFFKIWNKKGKNVTRNSTIELKNRYYHRKKTDLKNKLKTL